MLTIHTARKSNIPHGVSNTSLKPSFFQEICDKVVTLDKSIRFVGIADADGKLVAVAERKGLKAIMTPEERAQYAITAATR